jgi:hypothetical protein
VSERLDEQPGIGRLHERSLHAALKALYARPGDAVEQRIDGLVIDLARADGELVEIQTGNFSALKRKLMRLLPAHRVRVVHPVIGEKWIVRIDGGRAVSRRRSPLRADASAVFRELVYLPDLIAHPNLTLDVLTVRIEQYLENDGAGSWRRSGWSIRDTHLLAVLDQAVFERASDYAVFLPGDLPAPFTAADLARLGRYDRRLAGKMVYCLRHIGLIRETGRAGRAIRYERV